MRNNNMRPSVSQSIVNTVTSRGSIRRPAITTTLSHACTIAVLVLITAAAFAQDSSQTQPAPVAASQSAGTAVPRLVRFSGVVKDPLGKPVSGPVSVTFSLFAEQNGGTPLWSETQMVDPDTQGNYTVFLGATNATGLPLEVFTTGAARWLAVEPGVPAMPDSSRVLLVGVPYALKAADADTLGGKPASAFLLSEGQTQRSGSKEAQTQPLGNNAVAAQAATDKTSPAAAADITGSGTDNYIPKFTGATTIGNSAIEDDGSLIQLGLTTNPRSVGVYSRTGSIGLNVQSEASKSVALEAVASGATATGVFGKATAVTGTGVFGDATDTTKSNIGVDGLAAGPAGEGVEGYATGKAGFGVYGEATETTTYNYGVAGFSSGAGGYGIAGVADNTSTVNYGALGNSYGKGGNGVQGNARDTTAANFGVSGNASGPGGEGVQGVGLDTTKANWGVVGIAHGPGGQGIQGFAPGTTAANYGVVGIAKGPGGWGVRGQAQDTTKANFGVEGDASGPSGVGVYGSGVIGVLGITTKDSYAGDFEGDVDITQNLNVSGTLTAGAKNFKIDHPLDPTNKYLLHASVESNEMVNVYSGNIVTNAQGEALVQLPDWFEAVNTDFRYQLTVIGQFAQAIIAGEVANHSFRIQSDKPNVKISWQITGVRHDVFAQAHPLEVEQPKNGRERGFYIHPELYGAPEEKGIGWARNPDLMRRMREGNPQLGPSPAAAPIAPPVEGPQSPLPSVAQPKGTAAAVAH